MNPVKQINVTESKAMLESETPPHLLDVREDFEREICKLPQSVQLSNETVEKLINEIPKDAPIIFMCHHGIRSLQAAQFFAQHGFTDVASMEGGIDAWSQIIDAEVARY